MSLIGPQSATLNVHPRERQPSPAFLTFLPRGDGDSPVDLFLPLALDHHSGSHQQPSAGQDCRIPQAAAARVTLPLLYHSPRGGKDAPINATQNS